MKKQQLKPMSYKPTKEKFDLQKYLKENKFKLEGNPGEQTWNKRVKTFLGELEIELDLGKSIYAIFLNDIAIKPNEPFKKPVFQKLVDNLKKLS